MDFDFDLLWGLYHSSKTHEYICMSHSALRCHPISVNCRCGLLLCMQFRILSSEYWAFFFLIILRVTRFNEIDAEWLTPSPQLEYFWILQALLTHSFKQTCSLGLLAIR